MVVLPRRDVVRQWPYLIRMDRSCPMCDGDLHLTLKIKICQRGILYIVSGIRYAVHFHRIGVQCLPLPAQPTDFHLEIMLQFHSCRCRIYFQLTRHIALRHSTQGEQQRYHTYEQIFHKLFSDYCFLDNTNDKARPLNP